jgi:hypothetical protein
MEQLKARERKKYSGSRLITKAELKEKRERKKKRGHLRANPLQNLSRRKLRRQDGGV